jgi:hypothetical protein
MPLYMDVHHQLPEGATASTVHREAHGLVADELYEVVQG